MCSASLKARPPLLYPLLVQLQLRALVGAVKAKCAVLSDLGKAGNCGCGVLIYLENCLFIFCHVTKLCACKIHNSGVEEDRFRFSITKLGFEDHYFIDCI